MYCQHYNNCNCRGHVFVILQLTSIELWKFILQPVHLGCNMYSCISLIKESQIENVICTALTKAFKIINLYQEIMPWNICIYTGKLRGQLHTISWYDVKYYHEIVYSNLVIKEECLTNKWQNHWISNWSKQTILSKIVIKEKMSF